MPFCKQDEVYLKMGVSFDESVYLDYLSAHWDNDLSKDILGTAAHQCEKYNNWPMAD